MRKDLEPTLSEVLSGIGWCSHRHPCDLCRRRGEWESWLEHHARAFLPDMEDRQALADMLALAVEEVPS
jgi:hypothetical protein